MDLSAAWRLSRVVKRLRPDVVHAHDAHRTAMASLGLSLGSPTPAPALIVSRRVDFHLNRNSFSRWKHRAGRLLHRRVRSDPPRCSLPTAFRSERAITVHEGIDLEHVAGGAAGQRSRGLLASPSGAGRRQRRRTGASQGPPAPHRGSAPGRSRDARYADSSSSAKAKLREQLERQIRDYHLEKQRTALPGFRTDVIGCIKGFDLFVMSSVTEGLGTSLLDAMACSRASVATRAGGIPELVEAEPHWSACRTSRSRRHGT